MRTNLQKGIIIVDGNTIDKNTTMEGSSKFLTLRFALFRVLNKGQEKIIAFERVPMYNKLCNVEARFIDDIISCIKLRFSEAERESHEKLFVEMCLWLEEVLGPAHRFESSGPVYQYDTHKISVERNVDDAENYDTYIRLEYNK